MFATSKGRIYKLDSLNSWNVVDSGLHLVDIKCFAENGQEVFIGSSNRGIWHRPLIDMMTGVLDYKMENKILFFPNPVTNILNFKNLEPNSMISIFDLNGKILISKEIDNSESINVSNFSKGIYIVKVQIKDEVITQKFIKE